MQATNHKGMHYYACCKCHGVIYAGMQLCIYSFLMYILNLYFCTLDEQPKDF